MRNRIILIIQQIVTLPLRLTSGNKDLIDFIVVDSKSVSIDSELKSLRCPLQVQRTGHR